MKTITRRHLIVRHGVMAAAAMIGLRPGHAADFPSRPVRVIVPQAPGGAADQMIRVIAERLESIWSQTVLIEYKPGGGSVLATQSVARSAPDGYTIGTAGSSLTLNSVLRKNLPYTMKDVQPLARIGYYTTVLLAHPSLPANNVAEVVALAKTTPQLYGSNGVGSAAHLAGELLNKMAGIEMQHVPYNGASKLYTDMVGGRLPLGFAIASSADAFVKSGQLKVIGVTSAVRSPLYPAWPAIAETLPGYEAVNWAGIYGPAGLPHSVSDQISADIVKALRHPDTRKALMTMGVDLAEQPGEEFAAFLSRDIERIVPVSKQIGTLD